MKRETIDRDWLVARLDGVGRSLRDLSEFLDLDPSATSRLLSGRRRLRLDEADRIAAFLNVPPNEVLKHAGIASDRSDGSGRPDEVEGPSDRRTPVTGHASDLSHVVLAFDDNRLIGDLYGEFDQNLAEIERRLRVTVIAHGNQVTVKGGHDACDRARRVLETLWERLQAGHEIHQGDVDGAIRMAEEEAEQLPLPTLEPKNRYTPAQISTRRKTVSARTPAQDAYVRAMGRSDLVFGIGPAGTGKTYLAVAYAAALLERGDVDRLILSRPAVEAGERLGFLPGDMKEKVDPYLRPLYDALYDMMAPEKVERGLQSGMIEVAPLAFMRGRTLANAVVLLDEAQNCTAMQMKMFLTRLGENSRMIVTGDPTQVDLPSGTRSGLVDALEILAGVEGIVRVNFTEKDVVRHELVARIVRAYDETSRRRLEAERDARGERRP